jgi:hypothetical protein
MVFGVERKGVKVQCLALMVRCFVLVFRKGVEC